MEKIRKISYTQAINEALNEEMERDENVFVIAYEAKTGGTFKCSKGLIQKFGPDRVIDAPISENGEVGLAIGSAFYGMRPVVEIMLADFSLVAFDQIVIHMAKFLYLSAGQLKKLPIVIRMPVVRGTSMGPHHSQALYAAYAHFPGLKIVYPTNPYDAKGMLKSAIRDNNPVLFFEPISLYTKKGEVPEEEYLVPLDKASKLREGKDLTIAACGVSVAKTLSVTEQLMSEGIDAEVFDIRSIKPLDIDPLVESVKKTGKLLIVDESYKSFGITGEIAYRIQSEAFQYLKKPIERVTMPDISIPVAPQMEKVVFTQPEWIIEAAEKLAK